MTAGGSSDTRYLFALSESYSAEAREWAIANDIIEGSGTLPDGSPNYMWEDVPTREQLITVIFRVAQLMGKA